MPDLSAFIEALSNMNVGPGAQPSGMPIDFSVGVSAPQVPYSSAQVPPSDFGGDVADTAQPYQSNFGQTSRTPYTRANLGADIAGSVMNAFIASEKNKKAKEQQTAQSAMQLLKMGYPSEVVLSDPKVLKAVSNTLGITLPKNMETGETLAPKKPAAQAVDELTSKYIEGKATPEEQQRLFNVGQMTGAQGLAQTKMGVMGSLFKTGYENAAQLEQQYNKSKTEMMDKLQDSSATPLQVNQLADYFYQIKDKDGKLVQPTPPDMSGQLNKSEHELQKILLPGIAAAFPELESNPAALTLMSQLGAKKIPIDPNSLPKGLINWSARMAAVNYQAKVFDAIKTKAEAAKETLGITTPTDIKDVAGNNLPMAVAQTYTQVQEVQQRVEQMKRTIPQMADKLAYVKALVNSGAIDDTQITKITADLARQLGYSVTNTGFRAWLSSVLGNYNIFGLQPQLEIGPKMPNISPETKDFYNKAVGK